MKNVVKVILVIAILGTGIYVYDLVRPLRFDHLTDDTFFDTTETEITNNLHPDGREAKLLSAFFGLDSELPKILNRFIHRDMGGKDGMPVVFSHELDVD